MLKLCAFADEIANHTETQIAVLQRLGIDVIELRRVEGRPFAELDERAAIAVARRLRDAGIRVAVAASAIGKQPADTPRAAVLAATDHALTVARRCAARAVRVFSFFAPRQGGDDTWLRLAGEHLRAMAERVSAAGLELWLENEKETYATSAARTRALLEGVAHPALRSIFDPTNFEQCGERAFPDAYRALVPWLAHVHVKDVDDQERIVVAGGGRVGWPRLLEALRDDGYRGMLSLEPHLRSAGITGGFSGEGEFAHAAAALRALLEGIAWPADIGQKR